MVVTQQVQRQLFHFQTYFLIITSFPNNYFTPFLIIISYISSKLFHFSSLPTKMEVKKYKINMCFFMFIIFILIQFHIDINNDELLETIWEHNRERKKKSCKVVRLSIILLYSIFFAGVCMFPQNYIIKRRVTKEPRSNQLPQFAPEFADINRVVRKVSRLAGENSQFWHNRASNPKLGMKILQNEIIGLTLDFFSSNFGDKLSFILSFAFPEHLHCCCYYIGIFWLLPAVQLL